MYESFSQRITQMSSSSQVTSDGKLLVNLFTIVNGFEITSLHFRKLGLTLSHYQYELFHMCERLCIDMSAFSWIRSDAFTLGEWVFSHLLMTLNEEDLHFRDWVWHFHTVGGNFITAVNDSRLIRSAFSWIGADAFTLEMWIFSQLWMTQD